MGLFRPPKKLFALAVVMNNDIHQLPIHPSSPPGPPGGAVPLINVSSADSSSHPPPPQQYIQLLVQPPVTMPDVLVSCAETVLRFLSHYGDSLSLALGGLRGLAERVWIKGSPIAPTASKLLLFSRGQVTHKHDDAHASVVTSNFKECFQAIVTCIATTYTGVPMSIQSITVTHTILFLGGCPVIELREKIGVPVVMHSLELSTGGIFIPCLPVADVLLGTLGTLLSPGIASIYGALALAEARDDWALFYALKLCNRVSTVVCDQWQAALAHKSKELAAKSDSELVNIWQHGFVMSRVRSEEPVPAPAPAPVTETVEVLATEHPKDEDEKERYRQFKEEIDKQLRENTQLREQIGALRTECAVARSDSLTKTKQIVELGERVDSYEIELQKREGAVKEAELNLRGAQERMQEVLRLYEESRQQIERQSTKIADGQGEIGKLRVRLKELEANEAKLTEQDREQQQKIMVQSKQLQQYTREVKQLKSEKVTLEKGKLKDDEILTVLQRGFKTEEPAAGSGEGGGGGGGGGGSERKKAGQDSSSPSTRIKPDTVELAVSSLESIRRTLSLLPIFVPKIATTVAGFLESTRMSQKLNIFQQLHVKNGLRRVAVLHDLVSTAVAERLPPELRVVFTAKERERTTPMPVPPGSSEFEYWYYCLKPILEELRGITAPPEPRDTLLSIPMDSPYRLTITRLITLIIEIHCLLTARVFAETPMEEAIKTAKVCVDCVKSLWDGGKTPRVMEEVSHLILPIRVVLNGVSEREPEETSGKK